MRRLYIFRSFLALSVFILSVVSAGDSFAQKASLMVPQTSWAVNKVPNANDIDQAYCAIAKRYDRETIFTLAKNTKDETSIAIDFQSSLFDEQESMGVVFDPGASQERSFQVLPVNEKAIVVRLGQDESFFTALRKTGFLRVEAGEQSYHFNIADIDQGENILNECVTSLTLPEVSNQEYMDSSPSLTQDETSSLRSEIQELRDETHRLSSLLSAAQSDVVPLVGNIDDDKRVAALKNDNERLRGAMLSLENAVSNKQAQIDRLQASTNEGSAIKKEIESSQIDWAQTMSSAREKILELEHDKGELLQQLSAAKLSERQRVDVLQDDLDLAQKMNADFELKIEDYKKNEAEQAIKHQQIVQSLNGRIETLQEQIKAKNIELTQLSPAIDEKPQAQKENAEQSSEARVVLLKGELSKALGRIKLLENMLKQAGAENLDFAALESQQALFKAVSGADVNDNDKVSNKESVSKSIETSAKGANVSKSRISAKKGDNVAQADLKAEDFLNAPMEVSKTFAKPVRTEKSEKPDVVSDPLLSAAQAQEDRAIKMSLEDRDVPSKIKQQIEEKSRQNELAIKGQKQKIAAKENMRLNKEKREQISDLAAKENGMKSSVGLGDIQWNQRERMVKENAGKSEIIDILDRNIAALSNKESMPQSVEMPTSMPAEKHLGPPIVGKPNADLLPVAGNKVSGFEKHEPIKAIYQPAYKIQDIVSAAHIAEPDRVQYVEEFSDAQSASYSWQVSNVYGSAELKPLLAENDFDSSVKTYLEKTQERCTGDFAIVPEYSKQMGSMRVDSYDIACVGGGDADSSASLLFFNKSGTFTALAHEAPLNDMGAAITLRDRIKDTLLQSSS